MSRTRPTLTARELSIMKVVWDRGDATVRDVHQVLTARRPVAYTTVMTLMNILQSKGFLRKRRGPDRAFVYAAARPRQQVFRAMIADFVERVFDGAAQPLRLHLVQHEPLSEAERRELRRVIDALED